VLYFDDIVIYRKSLEDHLMALMIWKKMHVHLVITRSANFAVIKSCFLALGKGGKTHQRDDYSWTNDVKMIAIYS
jgi:hypothetical protein